MEAGVARELTKGTAYFSAEHDTAKCLPTAFRRFRLAPYVTAAPEVQAVKPTSDESPFAKTAWTVKFSNEYLIEGSTPFCTCMFCPVVETVICPPLFHETVSDVAV